MRPSPRLQRTLQRLADAFVARWPRSTPDPGRLKACRIVSHRGEHDNRRVLENTEAAFDRALRAGVWGIELDVRWTADVQPVVFHDPDTRRLFGTGDTLSEMTLAVLQERYPSVPTLASIVQRFGGRAHLMIELKSTPEMDADACDAALERALSPLAPVIDYHLLSLSAAVLRRVRFAPRRCRVPIAEFNVRQMSETALEQGYGGLSGHCLLVGDRRLGRHHRAGQSVGTGFASSRYGLYREVSRGVDWIFSDHAARLQAMVRQTVGR